MENLEVCSGIGKWFKGLHVRPWDRVERWVCMAVSRPQSSLLPINRSHLLSSSLQLGPYLSHVASYGNTNLPGYRSVTRSQLDLLGGGRSLSPSFAVTTKIIKRLLRLRLPGDRVIFKAGT